MTAMRMLTPPARARAAGSAAPCHLPALGIGPADDRAFDDVGVLVEGLLDLRGPDVVARGDDHVVAARLVPEVAVGVADVGVAGDVPAVLHVHLLARVGEVAAARRALDGQPARDPDGGRPAVVGQHGRAVPGDGAAGGARADVVVGGGDEHVQHLGAADAVDQPDAGPGGELLPDRPGQVLPGRHRAPDAGEQVLAAVAQHGPVAGGGGEDDGRPVPRHRLGQLHRRGLLDEQHRGAHPQREDQQAAEAEGERQRRGAGEDVVRPALHGVRAEGVGDGEHVAVEVHGDLGDAGAARRRRQQRDVVGRGVDVGEGGRLPGGPDGDVVGSPGAEAGHGQAGRRGGRLEVGGEPGVAQRQRAAGEPDQLGQLGGAQHGHGGHGDAAGLEDGEPAGHQPRVVG
jgi:hypothetical protein